MMNARKLEPGKLVIASHNQGKVREIRDLLGPYGLEPVSAGELGLPEPEETGDTFIANAELKARAASQASGLVALADDSGLAIDSLEGAPGIYSARWAGEGKDFGVAMTRVHEAMVELGDETNTARFVCALSLAWPDGHVENFLGRVNGRIVWPPRGEKGFGYDPIFQPLGHEATFGEMEPDAKHAISHRADAFHKLVRACLTK